jgi:hypothetical protein
VAGLSAGLRKALGSAHVELPRTPGVGAGLPHESALSWNTIVFESGDQVGCRSIGLAVTAAAARLAQACSPTRCVTILP